MEKLAHTWGNNTQRLARELQEGWQTSPGRIPN
jgi:hypothetical protein